MQQLKKFQPALLSYSFALAIVVLGVIVLYSPEPSAQAQEGPSGSVGFLSGNAWSDNIGWISFKGGSGASAHGVYVNPDGTDLTGYAWSDSIGWIDFNTTTCPGSPASLAGPKETPNLAGWALARSALVNGGGWDGCIKLDQSIDAGTAPVTPGGLIDMNGYAWGSDVVGWITYSEGTANVTLDYKECFDGDDNADTEDALVDTLDPGCHVGNILTGAYDPEDDDERDTVVPPPGPTGNLDTNPTSLRKGGNTNLTWSTTNAEDGTCQIFADQALTGFPTVATLPADNPTGIVANNIQTKTTFVLWCQPQGGGDPAKIDDAVVSVTPIPVYEEI